MTADVARPIRDRARPAWLSAPVSIVERTTRGKSFFVVSFEGKELGRRPTREAAEEWLEGKRAQFRP